MPLKPLKAVRSRVSISELTTIADRAQNMLIDLRKNLKECDLRKVAPAFSSGKVAKLCHIERADLNYLCTRGRKDGYPVGTLSGESRSRMFTLAETQAFVRANGRYQPRPRGQKGIVCAIGNFKANVGKTTCIVGLGQRLTLHGHKVLLIDLDPQASSTMLMGYAPDVDICEEMTVMPFIYGEHQDLRYAVKPSYWDGLELIPSCSALLSADYYLAKKQAGNASFDSWTILDTALKPLRDQYDVILIDTPRTFSYLAIAAFIATDGLVVPLPPEALDFTSSTQFFRNLAELFEQLNKNHKIEKNLAFIKIVLSKVNSSLATTAIVNAWINKTYHAMVTAGAIIETDTAKNVNTEFQTLYDIEQYDGRQKKFDQLLESFDSFVADIEAAIQNTWQVRLAEDSAKNGSSLLSRM